MMLTQVQVEIGKELPRKLLNVETRNRAAALNHFSSNFVIITSHFILQKFVILRHIGKVYQKRAKTT